MIKHIVAWRLKDSAYDNSKEVNAQLIKEKLENLRGKIPGLLEIEVGIDFSKSEQSSDVVLYSVFDSQASLEGYHEHPLHQALLSFIGEARTERRVIDYVIGDSTN